MIGIVFKLLASPLGKYLAIGLAVLAVAGGVTYVLSSTYNKGATAGETKVIDAVQADAIKSNEGARIKKEQINEEVTKTPYADRVDDLR